MGDFVLSEAGHPLEWWPLGKTAERFGIGKKKLKSLAQAGEVLGYQNPDFRRAGSEGEWFFSVRSVHEYHMRKGGFQADSARAQELAQELGY